jgi:hypothetical protein
MELEQTQPSIQEDSGSSNETTEALSVADSVEKHIESKEAASAKDETGSAAVEGATPQEVVAQAFNPDFKIKVRKQEYEIPEMYRGLMKDPQTAEEVRKTFAKAYGLEHVQTHRDQIQTEYQSFKENADPVLKIARDFEYHRSKGDLGSVFKTLNIPKDQIYKWAVQQAELEQLPEQQRRVYDEHEQAQLRAYELEQQLQSQQEQFQQIRVYQRTNELESVLSKPDVSQFIKAFDSKNGQDAFKNEVIQRGQTYWYTQGVDVPPERLVEEILNRFGGFVPQAAQAQAQPQAQAQHVQTTQIQDQRQVPVIPTTSPGSSAPVRKKITSLKDLEKAIQEEL